MNGPVEPTAAERAGAAGAYRIFVAMVQEGFTEAQALQMLGTMLAAQIQKPD